MFMKFFLLTVLLLLALQIKAQDFVPYMDGVPVMNAFYISADDIMIFDKPQGRVAEITLWCQTDCPEKIAIKSFYSETLQKLGLLRISNEKYQIKNTILTIDISNQTPKSDTIIVLRING
jgi:hypothetical protein